MKHSLENSKFSSVLNSIVGGLSNQLLMTTALLLSSIALAHSAQARIEVLFHPHDPTLEQIATWIQEADEQIDIAMYNMDTTDGSPVIRELKSPATQARLRSGELRIRLLFEGYATPAENEVKMQALEDLGIDVRFLGRSVKVHHKFAAIDTGTKRERVISGSANWSLSSYRNYHENIVFFEGEAEASDQFQAEFERLWEHSEEFGATLGHPGVETRDRSQRDLDIHFNTLQRLRLDRQAPTLTSQIVRAIDAADRQLDIATTRIRLPEVLEAIARAADRGVKIRAVINQDDYRDLHKRKSWLERDNIELRVKAFNLLPSEYLTHQMHNKFMIVDGRDVLTGSFNWSKSAESNHIENLIELRGRSAQQVLSRFQAEFDAIWDLGRDKLPSLQARVQRAKSRGESLGCLFSPIAMTAKEYRALSRQASECTP